MDKDYKKDWSIRFNKAAALVDKEECERLVDEYVEWYLDKSEYKKKWEGINRKYKAAVNCCKVGSHVIDGKDGMQKFLFPIGEA
jgi:hypothetical protein